MKAHTFWHNPYDDSEKDFTKYKADYFKSDYVTHYLIIGWKNSGK